MKLIFTLIFSLILNSNLYAQKTKKIKLKDKESQISEIFYVLKSDKSVKHGSYLKYYRKKKLIQGQYTFNKPSGDWNYYNRNGEIIHILRRDSIKSELIFNKEKVSIKPKSKNDLSRPVIALGGKETLLLKIIKNFRYPAKAREMGIQAK